ncbi:MAG: SDR family oxidoreductase [Pirellulales bacterium]|nr:SDR family oxidoreductase [Pirellulales bacterium]
MTLHISAADQVATRIVCKFKPSCENESMPAIPDESAPLGICQDREDYQDASGSLPLLLPRETARERIPELISQLPDSQTALLLATTRLVGTICPGLHSIYSSLKLTFAGDSAQEGSDSSADDSASVPLALNWKVSAYDSRFGSLSLQLESPVATGSIRAFVRPKPREQASFAELRTLVDPNCFSEQRALVVGGSRGFGEVCAKLLAAGGADVCITYYRGAEDAQRVVDDIVSGGGQACAMQFDSTQATASLSSLAESDWTPTHLFYFATPHIAQATKSRFSAELFREFCSYYVDALVALVDQLAPQGLRGLYYPSSVFVEELPSGMGEYAASKAAGEALCAFLDRVHPEMQILAPRLSKSATDQTASLVPTERDDPAPVLLESLRPFAE